MSRRPSRITFECTACKKPSKPKQIQEHFGKCHICRAKNWNLIVDYIDKETQTSPIGLVSLVTLGVGWSKTKTHKASKVFGNMSAETVLELTEDQTDDRVFEFVRASERTELLERGAINCQQCETLYVPFEHKLWNQNGFCSRRCSEEAGVHVPDEAIAGIKASTEVSNSIKTQCPHGHTISVMRSFSGCVRPCPICGEKFRIP